MKYKDLCKQMEKEKESNHKNDLIAKELLLKYLEKIAKKTITTSDYR